MSDVGQRWHRACNSWGDRLRGHALAQLSPNYGNRKPFERISAVQRNIKKRALMPAVGHCIESDIQCPHGQTGQKYLVRVLQGPGAKPKAGLP